MLVAPRHPGVLRLRFRLFSFARRLHHSLCLHGRRLCRHRFRATPQPLSHLLDDEGSSLPGLAMKDEVLDEFHDFLSEQVESLRSNLDVWMRSRVCTPVADQGASLSAGPGNTIWVSGGGVSLHSGAVCANGVDSLGDVSSRRVSPLQVRPRGAKAADADIARMGPGKQATPASPTTSEKIGHRVSERFSAGIARIASYTGRSSEVDRKGPGKSSGVRGVSCSALRDDDGGGSLGALRCILNVAATKRAVDSLRQPTDMSAIGMAKHFIGEWFSAAIIVLNAMSIGVSTEVSPKWLGWMVVDAIFAFLFLGEMLARMYTVGLRAYFIGRDSRCHFVHDCDLRWRLFEFFLVLMAFAELGMQINDPTVLDTAGSNFNILRTLRLTRIARILRVCRLQIFTELVMMINGAIGGLRTLLWSLALVAIPLYAVSLLMRDSIGGMASKGLGAEAFRSLPLAWFTMFRCTVAGDCSNAQGQPIALLVSENYGWGYGLIFCTTTIVMTFGLFNVIAAIFVENTLAAAKCNTVLHKRQRLLDTQMFAEKAADLVQFVWSVHLHRVDDPSWEGARATSTDRYLDERVQEMTPENIDEASGLHITPEFFTFLRTFREFKRLLEDLDIADEDQVDLFDTLDVDGGGTIDLEELVVGISKLRGDARRSDIVGVSLVVRSIQADISGLKESLDGVLEACDAMRKDMLKHSRGFPSQSFGSALSPSAHSELCAMHGFESSIV